MAPTRSPSWPGTSRTSCPKSCSFRLWRRKWTARSNWTASRWPATSKNTSHRSSKGRRSRGRRGLSRVEGCEGRRMSGMVARCRSCGFEQTGELADCPVCLGASDWWCSACLAWRTAKSCPACAGLLLVPAQVELGALPPGSRLPVRFVVKNRGKRSVACSVDSLHPALALTTHWLRLEPAEVGEITGTLILGQLLPGPHSYRVRFGVAAPTETELLVEVVAPLARLEFFPRELAFDAAPGKRTRRDIVVKNTGNVPVVAALAPTTAWLAVLPARLDLEPAGSTTLTMIVKCRKSDYGKQSGALVVDAGGGRSWELPVRVRLPMPEVAADAVDFGDVWSDRTYYQSAVLRNFGKVGAACVLDADQPWLAVTPKRVSLKPDGEVELKLRALIPPELAGPLAANVVVSFAGG